jgi:hypothetical protein
VLPPCVKVRLDAEAIRWKSAIVGVGVVQTPLTRVCPVGHVVGVGVGVGVVVAGGVLVPPPPQPMTAKVRSTVDKIADRCSLGLAIAWTPHVPFG